MRPPRRSLSEWLARSGVRIALPAISAAAARMSAMVGRSFGGFGNHALRLDLGGRQSVGTGCPRPADDLQPAVMVLGDGGAALDPVAGIDVAAARQVDDVGVVDMAADDPVGAGAPCLVGEHLLEGADVVDGILDLALQPAGERPIAEAEPAP